MIHFFRLIRVHQWIKNTFVFLPLFFSGHILNLGYIQKSLFAFFSFSLISSVVYIINDYLDIEYDREHPQKKNRPLASGAISKSTALIFCIFMLALNILFYVIGSLYFHIDLYKLSIVIMIYFAMNLSYTFKLKHIAIVDVVVIAFGFVLRVLAGGYASEIYVSQWAILLTFLLALVLALGKRYGELSNIKNGGGYSQSIRWLYSSIYKYCIGYFHNISDSCLYNVFSNKRSAKQTG